VASWAVYDEMGRAELPRKKDRRLSIGMWGSGDWKIEPFSLDHFPLNFEWEKEIPIVTSFPPHHVSLPLIDSSVLML
jgi:hypothetical protein